MYHIYHNKGLNLPKNLSFNQLLPFFHDETIIKVQLYQDALKQLYCYGYSKVFITLILNILNHLLKQFLLLYKV